MGESFDRLESRVAELERRLGRIARQVEILLRTGAPETAEGADTTEFAAATEVEGAQKRAAP